MTNPNILTTFRSLLDQSNFLNLKKKLKKLVESKEQVRIEEITTLITKYDRELRNESIKASDVIDSLKTIFPGKRGTGVYTPYQLNLFMQIRDAIKNQQLVVAGSKSDTKGKGLVGSHGYAVIDYEPHELAAALAHDPTSPDLNTMPVLNYVIEGVAMPAELFTPTLLSLKLVNPWGQTNTPNAGRYYSGNPDLTSVIHPNPRQTMRAKGNKNSQSDIELSDFTKRFQSFTISDSLTPQAAPATPIVAAPMPPTPSP